MHGGDWVSVIWVRAEPQFLTLGTSITCGDGLAAPGPAPPPPPVLPPPDPSGPLPERLVCSGGGCCSCWMAWGAYSAVGGGGGWGGRRAGSATRIRASATRV